MTTTAPTPQSALGQATPATQIAVSTLQGTNTLIEGATGTGKTTSLSTLASVSPDLEIFVMFTESGLESFLGAWTDHDKPIPENVHWHVLQRTSGSFSTLAKAANTISTWSMDALFKMQDPDRAKSNLFYTFLQAMSDFPDDRTGKKFGPVDSWGPNRVIAIDSLTGLNHMAMSLIIGNKPMRDQRDWGMAQDQLERTLRLLTDGCQCHFVLTAHIERETDQVMGGQKITVSTLGKALPPKITPMFSDVVLSYREGTSYLWSTANSQADLKARNLPNQDKLPQDFSQIFRKWQSRGGRLTSEVKR
jgi:hypothetical protein